MTSALRWSLSKRTTGMWLPTANRVTAARNRSPIWLNSTGEGIGLPRCRVKKGHDLPAHLQVGDLPVEVDAVQALKVQHHVPVQHLADGDRARGVRRCDRRGCSCSRRHRPPPGATRPSAGQPDQPAARAHIDQLNPASAVRGEASLDCRSPCLSCATLPSRRGLSGLRSPRNRRSRVRIPPQAPSVPARRPKRIGLLAPR
jgi:hypothetical protein